MAVINFARKEIEAKIVYYGPAMSGKTTNVQILHGIVPDKQRGELHTMATAEERTLFFDYVPVQLGQVAGFAAKFKLFTVPGQVFYKETRRVVLQGADAVVFVADSAAERADANIDALIDLEENLRAHGLDLASIPLVIQYNKRDAADVRSVADLETDLNPFGVPHVEAIAFEGRGVMETLRAITDLAANRIRDNLAGRETAVSLTAVERPEGESDQNIIRDHLERIKRVRPIEEQRGQRLKSGGHVKASDVDALLLANVERAGDYLAGNDAGGLSAEVTPNLPGSTPAVAGTPLVAGSAAAPSTKVGPPPSLPTPSLVPESAKAAPKTTTAAMVAAQLAAAKPAARDLPPPPPVPKAEPKPKELPPLGTVIEAAIDPGVWGAARLQSVVGAKIEAGNVRVDLVLDDNGDKRLRPVMLVLRAPEAPVATGPGWISVIGGAVMFGGIGLLVGIALGFFLATG